MSHDDFCKSTIAELEKIFESWKETWEADIRGSWERMRLHAVMVMQPHCKKRLIPERILPFPWEKKEKKRKTEIPGKEAQRERLKRILKKS